MQLTQVQSLGWEDPLEKGIATHSSILAWEIPWTEEPGGPQYTGSQRVRQDRGTNTHTHIHTCTRAHTSTHTHTHTYMHTHTHTCAHTHMHTHTHAHTHTHTYLMHLVFVSVRAFPSFPSCGARSSHCSVLSWCGSQALGHVGFSSCGSWAL